VWLPPGMRRLLVRSWPSRGRPVLMIVDGTYPPDRAPGHIPI